MKDAAASAVVRCTLCGNLPVGRAPVETTCMRCSAQLRACATCTDHLGGKFGRAHGEAAAPSALELRHGCPGAPT